MSEKTLSEIARNLEEHVKYESGYQLRFEEKLDLVLLQVTKTNGRVGAIEDWRDKHAHPLLEDYKENRAQAKGAVKLWTIIWVGLIALVGVTSTLYIAKIKAEIINEVKSNKQS